MQLHAITSLGIDGSECVTLGSSLFVWTQKHS